MSAQEPKHDWTVHGMTEREMKSRIKSHRAMTIKHADKAGKYAVPEAFLSPEFRTWVKSNPNSPWVSGGGMQQLQDRATKSYMHAKKAGQYYNTQKKLGKGLERIQLSKLQKSISKLTSGR